MKRIAIYLATTFGLTWTLWIAVGGMTGAFRGNASPLMTLAMTLGMFCPLIGALITNAILPREQRMDLRLHPRVKGNLRFYALAWFVPAAVSILGSVVFFVLNPQLFYASAPYIADQFSNYPGITPDQYPAIIAGTFVEALTYAPFINMLFAFGEEAGWRGMLFPSLCERMSPRAAVLVSGAIWGVWHAPITMIGHNYGVGYPGFPITGILSMVVFCTAVGCLLAWLRMRADSVWPCALAHGALNASAGLGVMFCTSGVTILGPSPAGIVAGIPLIALAAFVWVHMPAVRAPRSDDAMRD